MRKYQDRFAAENADRSTSKDLRKTALLMVLAVLFVAVTATYAWFTIADSTRVSAMRMDISPGLSFRISLDAHDTFEEYESSLSFEDIQARLLRDYGFDMAETPLEPVTTTDGVNFTFQYGDPASAESGVYLDVMLHFMSSEDLWAHLTERESRGNEDGTRIWSDENPDLVYAMRVQFDTDDNRLVYDPYGAIDFETLSDDTRLVYLPEGVDVPVRMRVWIEGTDEECTNDLIGTGYNIQLRFEATDEENNPVMD